MFPSFLCGRAPRNVSRSGVRKQNNALLRNFAGNYSENGSSADAALDRLLSSYKLPVCIGARFLGTIMLGAAILVCMLSVRFA